MKILYWNVRGLGNEKTRLVLKKLCSLQKPDLLFIAEPWISFEKIHPLFWNSLSLKAFGFNDRHAFAPNIWCLCALSYSPNNIASTSHLIRRNLWAELASLESTFHGPWLFMVLREVPVLIFKPGQIHVS